MSNKKISLLFLFLVVSLVLSGCSQKQNFNMENEVSRRPDFGQPEEKADIMGIVKSINGNEATVLKLDMPEIDNSEERFNKNESDVKELNEAPTFGAVAGGGGPGMGTGSNRGMRSGEDGDKDSQVNMIAMMKERASGEETIIIPVGIQMLKQGDAGNSRTEIEMIEASLEDVKTDTMINIWLNKDITDRQIANFILIR